jgi:hypothetical protein
MGTFLKSFDTDCCSELDTLKLREYATARTSQVRILQVRVPNTQEFLHVGGETPHTSKT